MQSRVCVVAIVVVVMAGAGPVMGGDRKSKRRAGGGLARCVEFWGGEVDMACLGGKNKGWSRLRVARGPGVGGDIPGAEPAMLSILPAVRDCHQTAIGRGASGVDGAFRVEIDVDDRGRAGRPHLEITGLTDKPLIDCITRHLTALRFRRPRVKGYGGASITIVMKAVGGPGKKAKTLTDDARAMCSAAAAMRAEGWSASRDGVLKNLATRFAESMPSAAGEEISAGLATVPKAEIPAAWRKALVERGVAPADAACPDLDKLLVGD